MSALNQRLCLAALAVPTVCIIMSLIVQRQNRKRKRALGTRKRADQKHLDHSLVNLTEDPTVFRNLLRMEIIQFDKLLQLIKDDITKLSTNMRECISSEKRLGATLRFLANGESYRSLMHVTGIHESTLSLLIPETLQSIYNRLKGTYLKMPSNITEWDQIATDFSEQWNFPLCIGALDGKHVSFRPPTSAGSSYYNYRGSHSIVLLTLTDANHKFIYINVGINESGSDEDVFKESTLKPALDRNLLSLPLDKCLPNQTEETPYVIIADDALPLTARIMKPFVRGDLDKEKRVYNYRLLRAQRVSENAFKILANRFKILLKTINLSPDKVEDIVLACCALHNFLATENPDKYLDVNKDNDENAVKTMPGLQKIQDKNKSGQDALKIRDNFVQYFNTVGAVPWQDNSM